MQQPAKEPLRGTGVAPALDQDVHHVAMLVDRPSEIVQLAADANEHLIQVPLAAGSWTSLLQPVGE